MITDKVAKNGEEKQVSLEWSFGESTAQVEIQSHKYDEKTDSVRHFITKPSSTLHTKVDRAVIVDVFFSESMLP